jgi:ssDNA-binding Zn-finger/Zn-ribbon topoisomerase 1
MNTTKRTVQPCPKCGDIEHQVHLQDVTLGGHDYEVWHCGNPECSASASTGTIGGGSHTHEVQP